LDKRREEAHGFADRYDAGPSVHGYQDYSKAVRAADRHDRIATRACNAWEKAEYWQRRTAGVISHALYHSNPGVRFRRIKDIEAGIRKAEKESEEYDKQLQTQKSRKEPRFVCQIMEDITTDIITTQGRKAQVPTQENTGLPFILFCLRKPTRLQGQKRRRCSFPKIQI
jgi:hypothetical protein